MSGILGMWNAIVESVGVLFIVCMGIGLMLGAIEPGRAFLRIGGVLGCMVLLLELPAILVGIWNSLTSWQHLGIIVLLGLLGFVILHWAGSWGERSGSHH